MRLVPGDLNMALSPAQDGPEAFIVVDNTFDWTSALHLDAV
jgi:hypothetical protein